MIRFYATECQNPRSVIGRGFSLKTDEASKPTEETKISISPFLYAIIFLMKFGGLKCIQ